MEELEARWVLASHFLVTSTADTSGLSASGGAGTEASPFQVASLRSAIELAEADSDADTIVVPEGAYLLTGGQLTITTSMSIVGDSTAPTILDGNSTSRVFNIQSGTVSISTVTIQNGIVLGAAGSGADVFGGGILVGGGSLTLTGSTVKGNQAIGGTNSGTFHSRGGEGYGGGIANTGGTLTVKNSTIANNVALGGNGFTGGEGFGGDAEGGGIYANSDTTIQNSTIAFNSAAGSNGTSGNGTGYGGGLYTATSLFQIGSSLVANNTATIGPDAAAGGGPSFTSLGFNLIRNGSNSSGFTDPTDQVGTSGTPIEPRFISTTLGYYGGPTATLALLSTSPALDKGKNLASSSTDQRGLARTLDLASVTNATGGDGTDIGAIEAQPLALVVDTNADENDGDYAAGGLSLREAIGLANANPGADTITFGDGSDDGGTDFTDDTPDTILLTLGQLDISSSVTITGQGATQTILDGGWSGGTSTDGSRILNIDDSNSGVAQTVSLTGLTLAFGNSGSSDGGAVTSNENLTISNSVLRDNQGEEG